MLAYYVVKFFSWIIDVYKRQELDLMLAEAEIKHLREKRGWVSVWTRQRLALLAAAIVVLAGYGGWLYAGTVEEPGVKLQNPAAIMASTELQKNLPQTEADVYKRQAYLALACSF